MDRYVAKFYADDVIPSQLPLLTLEHYKAIGVSVGDAVRMRDHFRYGEALAPMRKAHGIDFGELTAAEDSSERGASAAKPARQTSLDEMSRLSWPDPDVQ